MTKDEIKKTLTLQQYPDVKPPIFALISALQATRQFSRLYPMTISRNILKLLHVASEVKVLAVAGIGKPAPEEIWLRIQHMHTIPKCFKGAPLVGLVIPPVRRSQYHGLQPGMLITFKFSDIIDVMLTAHRAQN